MGTVLQRRERPLWRCKGPMHLPAAATHMPMGVEWTMQTGLVPTQKGFLYIDILTVYDTLDLIKAGMHPQGASLYQAMRALTFM